MKHLFAVKIVLKTVNYKYFLFFYFFFLVQLHSQISVNGFFNFNSVSIPKGYSNFFPLDFNNDQLTDLLLFDNNKKGYAILKGTENNFSRPIEKRFPYSINYITYAFEQNKKPVYLALSRKNRLAVLIQINSDGVIVPLNKVQFKSYPSYAKVGNFNNNGEYEAIICGENFNGITVLKFSPSGAIKQNKIVTESVFRKADFIDLDYDGYLDLVCLNEINNTLDYFYNTHDGLFRRERLTSFDEKIINYELTDFNNDRFTDIVLSRKIGFEILKGDSVSSFSNNIILNLQDQPDDFVLTDLNENGYRDLAFLNKRKGSLNIIFSEKIDSLNSGICYLNNIKYWQFGFSEDRRGKLLILLSKNNSLIVINKCSQIEDNTKIVFGSNIGTIQKFNFNNIKNAGLSFINTDEVSLNILLKNKSKLFNKFYKINLSEIPDQIKTFYVNKTYYFLLYKSNTSFCEVINYNFKFNTYKKMKVFTLAPMHDVIIYKEKEDICLKLLTKYKGRLFANKYILEENNFELDDNELLAVNVFDAKIDTKNRDFIYYWNLRKDKRYFDFYSYNASKDEHKQISSISLNSYNNIYVNSVLLQGNKRKDNYLCFINADNNYYLLIYNPLKNDVNLKVLSDDSPFVINDFSIRNRLVTDNNFLFINNSNNNYLASYKFTGNNLIFDKKISSSQTTNYFIGNYNNNKNFIVYTTLENNYINFKEFGN
ncbi:MAG: VCBS repeat-containing protein [bacterium]